MSTTYYYTPHTSSFEGGVSSSSDNSPQVRGGILAHERGHALSFLETFLSMFRREVSKFKAGSLTSNDKAEIKRIYNRCWKTCGGDDAKIVNDAHIKWYKDHGYNIEIR